MAHQFAYTSAVDTLRLLFLCVQIGTKNNGESSCIRDQKLDDVL